MHIEARAERCFKEERADDQQWLGQSVIKSMGFGDRVYGFKLFIFSFVQ
jgi:hypothetical protein